MSTIKAIVSAAPNKPEIHDVPYPTFRSQDQVLVKTTALAINPVDVGFSAMEVNAGCHVGWDFAGVVVEVGSKVTKEFKKGDRIAGSVNGCNQALKTDGAYAEYIVAKGDILFKIPDNMTDAEAATQGCAIITIGQSLYRDLKLPLPTATTKPPNTLFIYGGSTAMGIQAIQYAKLSNATVVTTSSPHNFDYLKSLGADHVLDHNSPTLIPDVLALTGNGKLKLALDARPSGTSATVCAKVLTREGGGRYAVLLPVTEGTVKKVNPAVEVFFTFAFTGYGEPWWSPMNGVTEAVPEDYEFEKMFMAMSEDLLARGKVKAPRVVLNRGGKGLEGVLNGFEEHTAGNISGGKLVYSME